MGCHAPFQRMFPTQESNLGLPRGRQIFYHLSHQESLFCICANIQSVFVMVVLFCGHHKHRSSEHRTTAPKGNIGLGSCQPLVTFSFTDK